MGILDQTVEIYERLRRKRFRISIENGTVFLLRFLPEQYHHLAGFQHLRDLTNISHPATGAGRFYRDVKKGRISEDEILRSAQFGEIAERLQSFSYIEQILCAGQTKIIVSFDPQKAHSQIKADYMLYHRDGGFDAAVYCGLFLRTMGEKMLPVTYVVEHGRRYVANQIMLDCSIEIANGT